MRAILGCEARSEVLITLSLRSDATCTACGQRTSGSASAAIFSPHSRCAFELGWKPSEANRSGSNGLGKSFHDELRQALGEPIGCRLQCGRTPAEDGAQRPRQRREGDEGSDAPDDRRRIADAVACSGHDGCEIIGKGCRRSIGGHVVDAKGNDEKVRRLGRDARQQPLQSVPRGGSGQSMRPPGDGSAGRARQRAGRRRR